ncbi:PilZ domain-containing protein [Methylobacterium oryzisoli]|uniref:PilZ domain-containing protein n=1 Tax=Methylobacterium oryzisoli TaxID=3385502 RepID=UPI003892C70D
MDAQTTQRTGTARDPLAGRRHRVMLQGRAQIAPDHLVPCVVRDLSRAGAKIRIERTLPLPERFALYIAGHDLRSVSAALRWRRGDFAGVAFADPPEGEPEGHLRQPTKL